MTRFAKILLQAFAVVLLLTGTGFAGAGGDTPLNYPSHSDAYIREWIAKAVPQVMSFDFQNHQEKLNKASEFFTYDGWHSFLAALETAGIVNSLEQGHMSLETAVTGNIVVLGQEEKNGRYEWTIQVPARMTYRSESKTNEQDVDLNILLVRHNDLAGTLIGIHQWVAYPVGDNG